MFRLKLDVFFCSTLNKQSEDLDLGLQRCFFFSFNFVSFALLNVDRFRQRFFFILSLRFDEIPKSYSKNKTLNVSRCNQFFLFFLSVVHPTFWPKRKRAKQIAETFLHSSRSFRRLSHFFFVSFHLLLGLPLKWTVDRAISTIEQLTHFRPCVFM